MTINDHYGTIGAKGQAGRTAEPHLPPKVAALRQKAGHEGQTTAKFRFYSLYRGMMTRSRCMAAWESAANGGAPGVDGDQHRANRTTGKWRRQPASEFEQNCAPKPTGRNRSSECTSPKQWKMRPLGHPRSKICVRAMAALLVLEPIFEADFVGLLLRVSSGALGPPWLGGKYTSTSGKARPRFYDADSQGYTR